MSLSSDHTIELLEHRRLLSMTVAGGAVALTGTAGNDSFVIQADPADPEGLLVSDGLATTALARSAVRRITVGGGEGDDQLVIDNGFGLAVGRNGRALRVAIDGGAGRDRVVLQGNPGVPDLASRYTLGRDANSGVVTTGNRQLNQTVKFNNVEEIVDLTPAATLAVSANGRPNAIDIINGPATDTGATMQVNIHNVRAPNGSASGGDDRVRLAQRAAFAPITFGNKQQVALRGMGGADYINLDAANGAVGLQSLSIDGAGGRDTLAAVGTPASIAAGFQHNGIERVQQQRQFGFGGGGTSSGGGMSSGASNASSSVGGSTPPPTNPGIGSSSGASNASSSGGGTAVPPPLAGSRSSSRSSNASSSGNFGSTPTPAPTPRPTPGGGSNSNSGGDVNDSNSSSNSANGSSSR